MPALKKQRLLTVKQLYQQQAVNNLKSHLLTPERGVLPDHRRTIIHIILTEPAL